MKIHYHPDTDSLYIEFQSRPGADADEIAPDVVVDFAEDGSVVGIDIDHASQRLDLEVLEVQGLSRAQLSLEGGREHRGRSGERPRRDGVGTS